MENMKILPVCALFTMAFISLTLAFCYMNEVKQAKHKWSTNQTFYFEIDGRKYGVGSYFTDLDKCMECNCLADGCSCCGIGYYAGKFLYPGCEIVADGCEMIALNMEKTALCKKKSLDFIVTTKNTT